MIPGRAVVTGGCGFIGSHIVDELVEHGSEVLVIDDLSSGTVDNIRQHEDNPNVEFEEYDIAEPTALSDVHHWRPDAIFHLAAQSDVGTSWQWPELDARDNVQGTLAVIRAAKQCFTPIPVIFASTGGAIYGDCEVAKAESSQPHPRSPYAVSKLAAEGYLRTILPFRHVILRFANVYGPRQMPTNEGGVVAVFTERLAVGEGITIEGDGRQTRDFVHVKDIAAAALRAWSAGGTFNLGTGVETSIWDLAHMIRVALGRHEDDEPLNVTFEDGRQGEINWSCLDSSRAFEAFQWEPRDILDGLRQYAQEFV